MTPMHTPTPQQGAFTFIGFTVMRTVEVFFADEGRLHYAMADDQDPTLLEGLEYADELPDHLELVWAGENVAIRQKGATDEISVSGSFEGFAWLVEGKTFDMATAAHGHVDLFVGERERAEQVAAALTAMLWK